MVVLDSEALGTIAKKIHKEEGHLKTFQKPKTGCTGLTPDPFEGNLQFRLLFLIIQKSISFGVRASLQKFWNWL